MAENQNNQQQESQQDNNNGDIKLTQEQFNQLIQASQNNNNQQQEQRRRDDNMFVKGFKKTTETLDTGTRGMDGSVFSIFRWIASFVKDMIDGAREAISMYMADRRRKKEEDDE